MCVYMCLNPLFNLPDYPVDSVRAVRVCTLPTCHFLWISFFFSYFFFFFIFLTFSFSFVFCVHYESQEGVVQNSVMGNLTTVKRACSVYAAKKKVSPDKVISGALQSFMTAATGNYHALPTPTYVFSINMIH